MEAFLHFIVELIHVAIALIIRGFRDAFRLVNRVVLLILVILFFCFLYGFGVELNRDSQPSVILSWIGFLCHLSLLVFIGAIILALFVQLFAQSSPSLLSHTYRPGAGKPFVILDLVCVLVVLLWSDSDPTYRFESSVLEATRKAGISIERLLPYGDAQRHSDSVRTFSSQTQKTVQTPTTEKRLTNVPLNLFRHGEPGQKHALKTRTFQHTRTGWSGWYALPQCGAGRRANAEVEHNSFYFNNIDKIPESARMLWRYKPSAQAREETQQGLSQFPEWVNRGGYVAFYGYTPLIKIWCGGVR